MELPVVDKSQITSLVAINTGFEGTNISNTVFSILLDENNNIINETDLTNKQIDELFLKKTLSISFTLNSENGTIKIADSTFLFSMKSLQVFEYSGHFNNSNYGIVYTDLATDNSKTFKQIIFLDITESQLTLSTLLSSLLLVGASMLIAIFGISFSLQKRILVLLLIHRINKINLLRMLLMSLKHQLQLFKLMQMFC
ncbi:hypothetical protein AZF37_02140 [endosymbiont 'TC1' of Trimyema compressum]|uniref:hypothetical protein n=1 Tax=endosymbiont 'TC1' of Trimyema compressum TaxID=243899 RepID=UPI0007F0941F|nr:hypothetical protein [endosymbiont 'TC1' of Trimyema compressum]AMP20134.1 hypothetical protein AZF37_02140 [endosymbiont 'TC1' of Trimyema compressum]